MIERKTTKGVSKLYLDDLRYRLGVFKEAFHCDVSAIAPDDVAVFFDGLKLSPRSHNNFLCALRTFFRFAQKHDWLSKEVDLLVAWKNATGNQHRLKSSRPPSLRHCLNMLPRRLRRASRWLRLPDCVLRKSCAWNGRTLNDGRDSSKWRRTRQRPQRAGSCRSADSLSRWLAIAPRNGERVWPHSKAYFFKAHAHRCGNAKITWNRMFSGIRSSVTGLQKFRT